MRSERWGVRFRHSELVTKTHTQFTIPPNVSVMNHLTLLRFGSFHFTFPPDKLIESVRGNVGMLQTPAFSRSEESLGVNAGEICWRSLLKDFGSIMKNGWVSILCVLMDQKWLPVAPGSDGKWNGCGRCKPCTSSFSDVYFRDFLRFNDNDRFSIKKLTFSNDRLIGGFDVFPFSSLCESGDESEQDLCKVLFNRWSRRSQFLWLGKTPNPRKWSTRPVRCCWCKNNQNRKCSCGYFRCSYWKQ
jgi:hypothetical protein